MPIKFGTDGWRAVISEEFTFDNVRKVAQAIADRALAEWQPPTNAQAKATPSLVVGFDTRFLSDRYARAVAEVLAANGIHVWLTHGDAPTPMVSYAIVDKQAAGGVMITASHNPPRYNGIKLKAAYGGGATSAVAKLVEKRIEENDALGNPPRRMELSAAVDQGLVTWFDPLPAYRDHVRTLVDFNAIRSARLSVVVDAMYGAGRVYLRRLLEEADCAVVELRGEMNPGFNGIHPEPIARHLQPLVAQMGMGRHHIGLATDGDADRIGAIDPDGRFIDPHRIMALLLSSLIEDHGLRGSVVKTVSTTQILNRLAAHYDLPVHETPVGFNYIADLMLTDNVLIGGEESGGISIQGHIPEGDGILMGLLLAELVAKRGKPLAVLADALMDRPYIGRFYYARHDRQVTPFDKATLVNGLLSTAPSALCGSPIARISDQDGVKYILEDNSWLLIRPSGTEPVLRIYAEAHSDAMVNALLEEGGALAARQLAALAA